MAMKAIQNNVVFHIGDTIDIYYKLIEKDIVSGKAKREKMEETRERTQIFQGIVIAIRGEGDNKTFMVRKIASESVAVERIFPLNSPWIQKIKVVKSAKVRRAKLYYLRKKVGKEAEKLKDKVKPKVTKVKKVKKKAKKKVTTKKTSKKTSKPKSKVRDEKKK